MKTMKAVCIYSYGGPDVLVYEDAPRPHPGSGEVLVRIHAAGINPVDWKVRAGQLKDLVAHTFPLVPGWDVSGVVESVGPATTRLKVGDEVYSRPNIACDGAYAEFMVVKEAELALKPRSIDHLHAAAIPLAGLTVWQALFDAAQLTAGQRVLIHAAAGGVGHLAVQLAKGEGAHVIGTASAKNLDFVRGLGADQVIDHRSVPFEDVIAPVDVVFDTVGGETQERSWKVLKRGGILVSIANPPSAEVALAHGVRSAFVFTKPDAAQLAGLAARVDAGKLKVTVETVLPLAEAARAQQLGERGHRRGKIVLQVI